jgi:hypothetical protein
MYLPGVETIVLFFGFMAALIIALASGTPLPPAILAAVLGFALTLKHRVELLEAIYGDRCALLDPVIGLDVKKDYAVLKLKVKFIVCSFLKIIDIENIENETRLGEVASNFISFLHAPPATVNVIAAPRHGRYDYYLKINLEVAGNRLPETIKGFSQLLSEIQRRLLSAGVYAQPVNPMEVLPILADLSPKNYNFTLPRVTLTAAALVAALAYTYPGLLPMALVLAPLIPLELRIVKSGNLKIFPKDFTPLTHTVGEVPDVAKSGASLRSFRGAVAWGNEVIMALLAPEDPAVLGAKARKAMEVLEAGRAGVSKLKDEFEAVHVINLYRALESGAMPFRLKLFANGEAWRLEPLGFERKLPLYSILGRKPFYEVYRAVIGLPTSGSGQLRVSSQLTWLSPYAFFRPSTSRTPKAIYLGRGLRRDEEVWLELDLLENVHGLIVGPMGSGKSTTARTVALRALERGIVPIIVDPSGEYRAFARRFSFEIVDLADRPFNILESKVEDLERALTYVSPLSEYETHLLRECLGKGGRSWSEVLQLLEGTSVAWKLERLEPYFGGSATSLSSLLSNGRPLLLCMGSTASGQYVPMPIEVQRLAVDLLLAQLRDHALAKGLSEPRWMLIVDEGHLFMQPPRGLQEPLIATVARMLRKFGLAVVVLTHEWGDVPEIFRRTAGWRLALAHSDPDYVAMTRVYMALTPSELAWFQRGVRGRAVLRRGHEPHNILVEVEPVEEARTDWIQRAQPGSGKT